MKQEQILKRLRIEAKELRLDYLACEKVTKSSILLKRRDRKMQTVHRLQTSINLLFINLKQDEQNYLQNFFTTIRENQLKKENVSVLQNSSVCFI